MAQATRSCGNAHLHEPYPEQTLPFDVSNPPAIVDLHDPTRPTAREGSARRAYELGTGADSSVQDCSPTHDSGSEVEICKSGENYKLETRIAHVASGERTVPTGSQLKSKRREISSSARSTLDLMTTSAVPATRRSVRLFIVSLGNPPPYHSTRHSAGHVLLRSLQSHLALPPLSKSKQYAGGHISHGSDVHNPTWTLFQCPTQMNVSGTAVMKAYKQFQTVVQEAGRGSDETILDALVVLHDEMEIAPATFKIRRGNLSAKGHNGIKSVQASLQSAGLLNDMSKKGKERLIKIGVGIGRPDGQTRERDAVSAYVLGQLTREEKDGIEDMTGRVIEDLATEVERLSLSR